MRLSPGEKRGDRPRRISGGLVWEERDVRQAGMAQTRGACGIGGRLRRVTRLRARHHHAAIRQWQTDAGQIPAETAVDRLDEPAAATRNAVLYLQRWPDYTEQRFFRALSSRRRAAQYRPGPLHAGDQGQGRSPAPIVVERHQKTAGG